MSEPFIAWCLPARLEFINKRNFIIYLSTKPTLGKEESGHCREVTVMGSEGEIWQIFLGEYNMFIMSIHAYCIP